MGRLPRERVDFADAGISGEEGNERSPVLPIGSLTRDRKTDGISHNWYFSCD